MCVTCQRTHAFLCTQFLRSPEALFLQTHDPNCFFLGTAYHLDHQCCLWSRPTIKQAEKLLQFSNGGFHLHLLVFPFVYQFNSRIGVLVSSSFANDEFRRISTTVQHLFKICLLWFLHEKECSFHTHLFCCTEMR